MAHIPVKIYELDLQVPTIDSGLRRTLNDGLVLCDQPAIGRSDSISSEVLRGNLNDFLSNVGQALVGMPVTLAGYHVEEIELSLNISAKGGISLIIGSAGGNRHASMKLTLKRA